jgi:hypothetical protein
MAEPSNATMLELLTKQLSQNNTGTSNYLDTLKSIYFGVGGNDVTKLEGGALGGIIDKIVPDRKPIDPAMLALIGFSKMAEASSQPGATALGGFGSGIQAGVGAKLKDDALQQENEQAKMKVGLTLASALKPKTGVPKTVQVGVVTGKDGKPVYDKNNNLLYNYQTYNVDGNIVGSFQAPKGSGNAPKISINTKEDTTDKEYGKLRVQNLFNFYDGSGSGANRQPGISEKAVKASGDLSKIGTIRSFLNNADTGALQSNINAGKKLLNRFGFDFDETKIGLGDSLEALTSGMVLQSVSQMKGALSDRELGFLQSMQANIGNTKAGNYLILLTAEKVLKGNQFFKDFKKREEISEGTSPTAMGSNTQESLKLGEKLRTEWNKFLIEDEKNLYDFLVQDRKDFVKDLRGRGFEPNAIRKAVKQQYFFSDSDGQETDALQFIKPMFTSRFGN